MNTLTSVYKSACEALGWMSTKVVIPVLKPTLEFAANALTAQAAAADGAVQASRAVTPLVVQPTLDFVAERLIDVARGADGTVRTAEELSSAIGAAYDAAFDTVWDRLGDQLYNQLKNKQFVGVLAKMTQGRYGRQVVGNSKQTLKVFLKAMLAETVGAYIGQSLYSRFFQGGAALVGDKVGRLAGFIAFVMPAMVATIAAACEKGVLSRETLAAGSTALLLAHGVSSRASGAGAAANAVGEILSGTVGGWVALKAAGFNPDFWGPNALQSYAVQASVGPLFVRFGFPLARTAMQSQVRDVFWSLAIKPLAAMPGLLRRAAQLETMAVATIRDAGEQLLADNFSPLAEAELARLLYSCADMDNSGLAQFANSVRPLFKPMMEFMASKAKSSAKKVSDDLAHFFVKGLDEFALSLTLSGAVDVAHKKFQKEPTDENYAALEQVVLQTLDQSLAYRPLFAKLKPMIEEAVRFQLLAIEGSVDEQAGPGVLGGVLGEQRKTYIEKMAVLFFTAYIPFMLASAPNLMAPVSVAEENRLLANLVGASGLLLEATPLAPLAPAVEQLGEALVIVKKGKEALRIEEEEVGLDAPEEIALTTGQKVQRFFMSLLLAIYGAIMKIRSLFPD